MDLAFSHSKPDLFSSTAEMDVSFDTREFYEKSAARRLDTISSSQTEQFFYTCVISLVCLILVWIVFEVLRNNKTIFMSRLTPTYIQASRVPPRPAYFPGAWIASIFPYSDEDVLYMSGLDGYMLLRFTGMCFRAAVIMSLLGAVLLLPLYATGTKGMEYWDRYTLANLDRDEFRTRLWAPVLFCYLLAAAFCAQLHFEFENFVHKRLQFLLHGDPDTPKQAYYTVCVERIPQRLSSQITLMAFFEKLFPGEVYSVEPIFRFSKLSALNVERTNVCRLLEVAVAKCWANNARPIKRISRSDFEKLPKGFPLRQQQELEQAACSSYIEVDEIDYFSVLLGLHDKRVQTLQRLIFDSSNNTSLSLEEARGPSLGSGLISESETQIQPEELQRGSRSSSQEAGAPTTTQSRNTATVAAAAAVRGVREAQQAGQLLTVGASSDHEHATCAFVTFKSRATKSAAKQMLLSNQHYRIQVDSASRPDDIIWKNASFPLKQVNLRTRVVSAVGCVVLILFGAFCAAIIAVFNLQVLAKTYPSIAAYSKTEFYTILNNYLAIGVLLLIVSLLPILFTVIAFDYEKRKQKSEVQTVIMNRYFVFQLVYVYVSVIGGSFLFSFNELVSEPDEILSILGETIPSFSIYFANVVIMKAFITVPLQMIRILPLIRTFIATVISNRDKVIIRDLRAGAFMNPPSLYGWSYPNVLLVLMIMFIYAFISPFILPFCALFFGMAYGVYKYQLLYVFIDEYQSGGNMWYSVFRNSMVALMGGVTVLLVYLAIRVQYASGPFYALIPLPFLISFFWKYCNDTFVAPCQNLSLEKALEIDDLNRKQEKAEGRPHHADFDPHLFRQPALLQHRLKPNFYREGKPFLPESILPQDVAIYKPSEDANATEGDGTIECRAYTLEDMTDPVVGDYTGLTLEVNAFLEGHGLVANATYTSIPTDDQEAMRREEGYATSAGTSEAHDRRRQGESSSSTYGTL